MPDSTRPMKPKKCKACGITFTPDRPLQCVCDYRCALALKKVQAEKANKRKAENEAKAHRADRKKAKDSIKSLAEWLDIAQKAFNSYIRARDKHLPCISCGTTADVQYAAGHFRSRGAASHLRFNEDNVHKQCNRYCNLAKSGNLHGYRPGIIERIGIERVEALENNNHSHKWTIDEAKEIAEIYRKKIKDFA